MTWIKLLVWHAKKRKEKKNSISLQLYCHSNVHYLALWALVYFIIIKSLECYCVSLTKSQCPAKQHRKLSQLIPYIPRCQIKMDVTIISHNIVVSEDFLCFLSRFWLAFGSSKVWSGLWLFPGLEWFLSQHFFFFFLISWEGKEKAVCL